MIFEWFVARLLGILLAIIGVLPTGDLTLPSLAPFIHSLRAIDGVLPVHEVLDLAVLSVQVFLIVYGFRLVMTVVPKVFGIGKS